VKIMVIEDERLIAKLIEKTLKQHIVVPFVNSQEALAVLRTAESSEWDLVICDVLMPYLSGISIYATLKEENSPFVDKFLFITGGSLLPAIDDFFSRHDVVVLEKPFKSKDLLEAIEQVTQEHA